VWAIGLKLRSWLSNAALLNSRRLVYGINIDSAIYLLQYEQIINRLGRTYYLMQYQVFVQSHTDNHFLASVVGMPNLSVEGATEAEAIAKVTTALEAQLATGKFVMVEVETQSSQPDSDPWIKHMGIFADDPTFDDFLTEVAAYRQQMDALENEV